MVLVACAGSALVAFQVGRSTALRVPGARSASPVAGQPPTGEVREGAGSVPQKEAAVPASVAGRADGKGSFAQRFAEPASRSSPAPAPDPRASSDATCSERLYALEQRVRSEELDRQQSEGQPIKKPPADLPERFSQGALTAAMTLALRQGRIPGRVETIDCAEYPCILYGRIKGDEDNLERIERAAAFKPYRADLMTMLSWTLTDQAFKRSAEEERPERMLFAVAFYTREDRTRLGDNLDRRIRVRAADLWNAIRPDDEE